MTKHSDFLLQQQHTEYCQIAHSALTGAVWDDELKKLVSYKELVNHCNNIGQDRRIKGGENEFGRLFQEFLHNNINRLGVLE